MRGVFVGLNKRDVLSIAKTALGRMLPLVSSTMSAWMSRFEVSDVEPPNPSAFLLMPDAMPA